jgi:hypothetical protein
MALFGAVSMNNETLKGTANIDELIRNVFIYVITAMNKSSINDLRHEKLKTQRRLLFFLYKFDIFGLLLFCFIGNLKQSKMEKFRDGIIDDHASGTIRDVIKRNINVDVNEEIEKMKLSRFYSFIGFFHIYKHIIHAYRNSKPDNFVVFTRCVLISKMAMKYYYYFKFSKPKYVLISDTTDPNRMALGIISEIFNVPVYIFSVARSSIRSFHPFKVNTYFCWTKEQAEYLQTHTQSNAIVMSAPIKKLKLLSTDISKLKIGLLLNAKYKYNEIQNILIELKNKFGLENIQVRQHPGKQNKELQFVNGELRDWREPLRDYFVSVDCVFVPNSNALYDSLLNGVPVIYVHQLGEGPYDFSGLVGKGLVIAYSAVTSFPGSVNDFYDSEKFKNGMNILIDNYCASNPEEKKCVVSMLNL